MARVALLTRSDGRDFVARELTGFCQEAEDAMAAALAAAGHQVERGGEPFPHFTMLAASATPGPLLLLGNIDPTRPGMLAIAARLVRKDLIRHEPTAASR